MQPSSEIVKNYLENLEFGQHQSYKNMTCIPLLSPDVEAIDYQLLDNKMIADGLIMISEVSEEASVPELKLTNNSEQMILLLDGEELLGAKQNRILNCSMLLAAKSENIIPVSCCEALRWSYNSSSSSSSGNRLAYRKLRARKSEHVSESLRGGSFRSNQSEVWSLISERMQKRKAKSASSDMSSIYENENDTDLIAEYMKNFSNTDFHQVGALFALNGLLSIECFGKHDTFKEVAPKLFESYVLDAIDEADTNKIIDTINLELQGKEFIQKIITASAEEYKSVSLGTDIRFSGINGAGLMYQDTLLHLSVFADEATAHKSHPRTRMTRPSSRRRMH